MEIALNSAIASSTHNPISIIGGGRTFPASSLSDLKDNICNEKYNVEQNNNIAVGHSILNLFGGPTERCKDEVNALASLTLKNALNVNSSSDYHVHGVHKLLKDNVKLVQCNNSGEKTQQQKHTNNHSKSSELLAALKITANKINTTSNHAKNKTNNSLNESSLSSYSSSSSSSSTSSSVSATSSSASLVSTVSSLSPSTLLSTSPPTSVINTPSATTTLTTNTPNVTFTTTTVDAGAPVILKNCSMNGKVCTKNGSQIPSDILDDLASRFIINVPDMELNNMIRICFQIELAHWFYLDFFCASAAAASDSQKVVGAEVNKKRKLPSCGIKQFAVQLFQHIPFLCEHLASIDKILDDWKNYKLAVPTFGAILISEDLNFCLLVQSYFAKCSWGFPKGKVNENEDPVHCATREVYEETGYDITNLIVPNDYIEAVINYQYTRLYIVRDVSLKTEFSPRTRNEIKCCDWFPIDSLPINKNDAISKAKFGLNANSFFMIMPFIKRLKRWVHDKRSGIDTRRKYTDSDSSSNIPTTLMATAAVAAAAAVGGTHNCKNINFNNQKQNNAHNNINNNSGKKIKQQHTSNKCDDKHNALNGGNGNTTINGNNNISEPTTTTAASNKCDNSKRSKRQRHKSMGDLDGIKLNNLSSNIGNSNVNSNTCKNVSNIITKTTSTMASSSTESIVGTDESSNCKTIVSQKRICGGSAVKLVAGGSSTHNGHNNSNHNSVGCISSKRQLFHSQSQNGSTQHGEKIVSSFDLIRKEKQQLLKTTAASTGQSQDKGTKAQRQPQLQTNVASNSGRERAKSQGDNMCVQQQPNCNKIFINNTNNIGGNPSKYGVQKQTTITVANLNSANNNNKDNILNKYSNNAIINRNTATNTARVVSNPSPSSGYELLAFAAEAATNFTSLANPSCSVQQKQRPASVSLHFETMPIPAAGQLVQQKLQRMASGTNLRILKRSTSFQKQMQLKQQQQAEMRSIQQSQPQQRLQNEATLQQQHQQQPTTDLKFKPSFNSWTNFSFTKNFIANVFC